jgi:uncharacterized damage-inducible protein DinB
VFHVLVHIYAVEDLYLSRWRGVSPEKLMDGGDFCGVDDIARKWEGLDRNIHFFLECLEEEELERKLRIRRIGGEVIEVSLSDMLVHTILHSMYHRGQVQYLVRREGHEPKAIDPLVFFLTNAGQTTIPRSILRELIEYTRWAEERTFASLRTLSPERLRESFGGGLGSAWETQVHAVAAMGGWLERMNGRDEFRMVGPDEVSGLEELAGMLAGHMEDMERLARIQEDLTDRIRIHSRRHLLEVSRAQLLFQLLTHAVHHRGQTMMLVRFAGGEPLETGYVAYALMKGMVTA